MSELLGEARVLIRPDTTAFRAELETAVLTAAKGVVVPVQVTAVTSAKGSTAAAAAVAASTEELNAALMQQGVEQERVTKSSRSLTAAENAQAVAAKKLALADTEVATAATEVSAAQTQATRSVAATAAAERAVTLARRTGNVELIRSTELLAAQAATLEAEKIAALDAARAEAVHAASLRQVSTAGIASGASLLGLRGAVLTAGAAFLGATVAIQAAIRAISQAAELEKQLNVFRVTAGATADEMKRVGETAKQLGSDITLPGVTAGTAAEALTELARAGLDVNESLNAVRGTLQLATAAQIDNAQATELVANTLNSFRLSGSEAAKVADLLAGAANESQGSIADMGQALRQVAPVAALVGFTVEDTVTVLTQLSRAGLSASDAGTSFRTAILRLIQDMPKVEKAVADLGLRLRDAQGALRVEVFAELQSALSKMSPAAREAAVASLGGADAIRTFGLLARAARGDFEATREAITRMGIAAEVASAQTQGFSGDVEALKNSTDILGVEVAQLVIGPLAAYVRGLADLVSATNKAITSTKSLVETLKDLASPLGEIIPFQDKVAAGFTKIAGTALKVQFLGPAITAAGFAMRFFGGETKKAGDDLNVFDGIAGSVTGTIDDLIGALRKAAGTIATPKDSGLNVKQIENVVSGFDEREVRARISGDTNTLIAVLQQEQDFLEQQLDREFVQRRPELRRKLENALLGVTNELASISQDAANKKKSAAAALATAQNEADQNLLDALSAGRTRQENRIAIAEQTTGLQDDIRAQVGLKRLLIRQIAVINEQVQDERAKASAILALTTALIATNGAIKKLQAQRKQEQADRKDQIQELNIQIAQERGNDAALERAINASIKTLNKQIRAAKGDQVKVKQLILERERLRNQLKDLNKADQETRNGFKTFVFEQLQAQQGFAANLLGNIIRGPTTGLVGVPSPSGIPLPNVDDAIKVGQGAAAARQGGSPTAGQQNTVIALLERILTTLKQANRADSAPEARYERRQGSAALDGIGGGGTNAVM